ncbi:hypothetical protein K437DRAFT_1280 [Tilletiaria anomala UBC 951]|uniref:Transglycosylase SLT domain-containing protein n=1 Tax=Tilletiaria anomala (strain ATCC 24038 / CBS 436.72 / UBC 951) TaxID=1037660 RepID=A0A066WRC0_TILAU|nr:uncharacterized protein K437DRAFT_1280 [Tilletiaria anomala UBC 951]KDN53549.1 hypothetical protein K437DRAFT_1280 [Tilletiaria anomala UBC 951]
MQHLRAGPLLLSAPIFALVLWISLASAHVFALPPDVLAFRRDWHDALQPSARGADDPIDLSADSTGNVRRLLQLGLPSAPSVQSMPSNNPNYNVPQVRRDLLNVMAWAGDTGALQGDELDETVAAIMSAAARYFPEVPTRAMCRTLIADIKTESDFNTSLISGGRLDSGSSWGLLQVSPGGGSQELKLFKQHAQVARNTFSWAPTASSLGPLIDWQSGEQVDLDSLTNDDLFRPWINIHVAAWIQSNSARTSSQDPADWPNIAFAAANVRKQAQVGANPGTDQTASQLASARQQLKSQLQGAGLPRSVRTGLGTWVAGAATDGYGSYMQAGDDISRQYISTIAKAVSHLYGYTVSTAWFNGLQVNAGLVDYQ